MPQNTNVKRLFLLVAEEIFMHEKMLKCYIVDKLGLQVNEHLSKNYNT